MVVTFQSELKECLEEFLGFAVLQRDHVIRVVNVKQWKRLMWCAHADDDAVNTN